MSRLLFVVHNPSFFLSHRLGIAQAAMKAGYEVHLACTLGEGLEVIRAEGIRVHIIPVDRADHGWLTQIELMFRVYSLCRLIRPDICHLITLKISLVAGMGALLAGVRCRISAISGLGFLFISQTWRTRVFRSILRPLFYLVLSGSKSKLIFQNDTDRRLIQNYAGITDDQVTMIRGSGVDLMDYQFVDEPAPPVKVVMACRLLIDKGVMEFLQAARQLKAQGIEAEFVLAGESDSVNPKAVHIEDMKSYIEDEGAVDWVGHCNDIADLFSQSHIVVLPSYREGFPKVLIEAAACGRAVVTTNVPGCRDAIIDGETGILITVKDSAALASAIGKLVLNPAMRKSYGERGRAHAEQNFDVSIVNEMHLELYSLSCNQN